ncbi:hypothetical protein FACS189475_05880 [Betaproteobacteria bacterium]|nr:hypothetical protein FACS189475_05880 [Betaproteobacteria bacterium]
MQQDKEKSTPNLPENVLYSDICGIIEGTRTRLATTVNAEICLLHWHVGNRIKTDILDNKRADYGKQIVKNLAEKLTARYGKGWSDRKLLHCIRAAYTFTEDEIVYAVRIQLSWTHLRSLMFIDDAQKRDFYMQMTRLEHWDTRTLDDKIDTMLYERTALSRKPEELIKQEINKSSSARLAPIPAARPRGITARKRRTSPKATPKPEVFPVPKARGIAS